MTDTMTLQDVLLYSESYAMRNRSQSQSALTAMTLEYVRQKSMLSVLPREWQARITDSVARLYPAQGVRPRVHGSWWQ